jgi:predicted ribosome quality control (RQC) complex YloA/Tae2 family protein
LGENLFAAARTPPVIPWKPSSVDKKQAEFEKLKGIQQEINSKEEAKSEVNDAAKEFNALAELITEAATNVETGNFHLNLFPKQPAQSSSSVSQN